MDYKASGVDIDAGNEAVRRIRSLARSTFTAGVLSDIDRDRMLRATVSQDYMQAIRDLAKRSTEAKKAAGDAAPAARQKNPDKLEG